MLCKIYDTIQKIVLIYTLFLFDVCRSDDHEYKLVKDLLKDYNSLARPSLSHLDPTNVSFDMSLSQLIDVDEKNQVITTNAWVTMKWTDYKLRWNESDYGGITDIRLPFDKIWKPDVILYNNADALASLAQISTHIIILSNGSVTWLSTSIYRSSCSIDVQYFPFDKQNCSLTFASWTYDGNSINLIKLTSDTLGDTSNYLANGEWNLNYLLVERAVKIYSCCPNPYPHVTYYIVITRRPLFYVFNMIFPSLLITLVGFLGFLIPPDSGEKISMGVTTLLSMTVFLMAISDSMPPNSDSVPLIASYYFGSMLIISLATAGTVLTLNVFKRGEGDEPVPPIIQKIFFDFIARILFINISLNRELDSSLKQVFCTLKNYYINSSVEKFINTNRGELRSVITNHHSDKKSLQFGYPQTNKKTKNLDRGMSFEWHDYDQNLNNEFSNQPEIIRQRNNSSSSKISPKKVKKLKKANSSRRDLYENNQILYRTTSINIPEYENNSLKQHQKITLTTFENEKPTDCLKCNDVAHEQRRLNKLLRALNDNLENNELKEVITLYKDELRTQWRQLAQVIDALLLYMFTISTFLMIFYLWKKAPTQLTLE